MAFTVEPMVTPGRPTFVTAPDGWTEHDCANCIAAQSEHTVHVTEDGVELPTVTADGRTAIGTPADLATPALG